MWGPWGYPPMLYPPMPNQQQMGPGNKPEDPFKTMKKWRKFCMAEEEAKKKKKEEEEKKDKPKSICEKVSVSTSNISQMMFLALVTMPITGPLYLITMAVLWKFVKLSLQ